MNIGAMLFLKKQCNAKTASTLDMEFRHNQLDHAIIVIVEDLNGLHPTMFMAPNSEEKSREPNIIGYWIVLQCIQTRTNIVQNILKKAVTMWQVKYNGSDQWQSIDEIRVRGRISAYCDNIIHLDTEIERLIENPGECFDTASAVYRYVKDESIVEEFDSLLVKAVENAKQTSCEKKGLWFSYVGTHDCVVSTEHIDSASGYVVKVMANLGADKGIQTIGKALFQVEPFDVHSNIELYTKRCAQSAGLRTDQVVVTINEIAI